MSSLLHPEHVVRMRRAEPSASGHGEAGKTRARCNMTQKSILRGWCLGQLAQLSVYLFGTYIPGVRKAFQKTR
ncbi:hypothetical protein GY45DRAFT_1325913 [Cubamyces sp. BRFM 1775]|nr:hypothetical protein GY45DRAFT_1325913 [Cubamyces sp. BRFM 1775]